MACNLVINFEVALIKKLWQFSVLSRTLPPTLGEEVGKAFTLRDLCDIYIGLSHIPHDNIFV